MRLSKGFAVLAGICAIAAIPAVAIASHGKAGLWTVTSNMNMQMAGMAQMPQMSPEQMERMRSMGVQMPQMGPHGMTTTTQHCMTAAEVNSDAPPPSHNGECQPSNVHIQGTTMTADMICSGEMTGTGHMTVTYDNPEHYSGRMDFSGTAHGQHTSMTDNFEGKWMSADCGRVAH